MEPVGERYPGPAFRLTGPLADLDADALVQMAEREQTCITLTI